MPLMLNPCHPCCTDENGFECVFPAHLNCNGTELPLKTWLGSRFALPTDIDFTLNYTTALPAFIYQVFRTSVGVLPDVFETPASSHFWFSGRQYVTSGGPYLQLLVYCSEDRFVAYILKYNSAAPPASDPTPPAEDSPNYYKRDPSLTSITGYSPTIESDFPFSVHFENFVFDADEPTLVVSVGGCSDDTTEATVTFNGDTLTTDGLQAVFPVNMAGTFPVIVNRAGYAEKTVQVTVTCGSNNLTVDLVKIKAKVRIVASGCGTDREGFEVTVGDQSCTTTFHTVGAAGTYCELDLVPGTHTITVKKDQYRDWEGEIIVPSNGYRQVNPFTGVPFGAASLCNYGTLTVALAKKYGKLLVYAKACGGCDWPGVTFQVDKVGGGYDDESFSGSATTGPNPGFSPTFSAILDGVVVGDYEYSASASNFNTVTGTFSISDVCSINSAGSLISLAGNNPSHWCSYACDQDVPETVSVTLQDDAWFQEGGGGGFVYNFGGETVECSLIDIPVSPGNNAYSASYRGTSTQGLYTIEVNAGISTVFCGGSSDFPDGTQATVTAQVYFLYGTGGQNPVGRGGGGQQVPVTGGSSCSPVSAHLEGNFFGGGPPSPGASFEMTG